MIWLIMQILIIILLAVTIIALAQTIIIFSIIIKKQIENQDPLQEYTEKGKIEF